MLRPEVPCLHHGLPCLCWGLEGCACFVCMHSERGVRSLLGGVMLCPQGPSLHHGLRALLLLGFGGLCVHSEGMCVACLVMLYVVS